jgi:hypothetical protein
MADPNPVVFVVDADVSARAGRLPTGFDDPEVRRTARAKALSSLQGLDRQTGGSPAESWIGRLS